MNRAGINDVRFLSEHTSEMLTALISPWTGQAWNGRLWCVKGSLHLHHQQLFRPSQLINRKTEMHLNWSIWLVLDVLCFLGRDNLRLPVSGLRVCVCALFVWTDRCSSSQTTKIASKQVRLGETITCAHTSWSFIAAGSIIVCRWEISWEH